ncbi:pyruvate kinase [Candidatus Haliotispira prima]|uniref:Pyruvate kinase n=1 Tax=Candidatus Haliotispira prima TaxID=3034016 RepID=A0ABY8MKL9_9SPIO|nr:pyruvate kinase [Candidatus Haliotispira prima]
MKKTKTVCTLGPSSNNKDTLLKMVECGMNVARLNFSHADHPTHLRNIGLIREVNEITQKNVGILLDTKGPEIRTHNFEGGTITFEHGDIVRITGKEVLGNREKISVTYQNIFSDIKVGQKILIDDGYLEFDVIDKDKETEELICQAVNGHRIKDKRGVNIPGADIQLEFISEKDRSDIEFGCDHNVDFIAASFVQTADDVREIEAILERKGKLGRIKIIAKIETVRAVKNILDILDACDGVMVARGDLGVEVEVHDVPVIQKHIIKACQAQGKVSITATQMLESMQQNPRPTRAEVSDVANAVLDGSDAVMLSGETAAGMYPVESVRIMTSICERIEAEVDYPKFLDNALSYKDHENLLPYTIASAVCHVSQHLGAKAIVTPSKSGITPRLVSKFRPHPPIIVITEDAKVATTLALHYGVYVVLHHFVQDYHTLVEKCQKVSKEYLGLESGDHLILSAGLPLGIAGATNEMRILTIP